MNKITLMGRLCKDTEVLESNKGVKMFKNTLAVKRKMNKDITDFISIIAFNKVAELICDYYKKGDTLLLTGNLQINDNGKDGDEKKLYTTVIVEEIFFTGSAKKKDDLI